MKEPEEEKVGDFVFRPPRKDGREVEDEMFVKIGNYTIHVERMSTEGIWVGITDEKSEGFGLNFFIDKERVLNEEGKLVRPLKLVADEY